MSQWKMIYLARRNPALAAEDFPQAWREHSALGRQCVNVADRVKSVAQCSRVLEHPDLPQGASADYDGVNLLALRDRQSADDIWSDAETLRIMRPDEPRVFSTYVRNFALTAREAVIKDGAQTEVCVYLFLKPRAPGALDEVVLAPSPSSPWAQAQRLVSNRVDGAQPSGYEYELIVEAWYVSVDAVAAAFAGQSVWAALPAELGAHIDAATSVCMLTRVTHRRP